MVGEYVLVKLGVGVAMQKPQAVYVGEKVIVGDRVFVKDGVGVEVQKPQGVEVMVGVLVGAGQAIVTAMVLETVETSDTPLL